MFRISDNGAGFDMNYAKRLFEPFQRMHSKHEFAGLGIGLATVRRVIQRHGGTITANAAPNRGATFSFTLPSSNHDTQSYATDR
jgi:light-regulated signal transduction histidine kinase (bacteriophytochrome)